MTMNAKPMIVSVVALVSLCLTVAAHAEPVLTPERLAEVAAKPASVAAALRELTPEQRLAAARELIAYVKQMNLAEAETTRVLANVAAACLAAVEPSQRVAMARALVAAGGTEHVRTLVAAVALAAGADEAGQNIVRAAVNAAAVISPELRVAADQAAQQPDVVLGSDVTTEVVRTVQAVTVLAAAAATAPAPAAAPAGPAAAGPIMPPPAPPRAHPYEAQ